MDRELSRLLAKLSPIPPEIIFQECIWYSTVASVWNIVGQ